MNSIFNIEKMLDFFSTVFYFFMTNMLFIFFNIPLVFFFLFLGISHIETYLPLFLVCLIPTGPALAALFYSMRQFITYQSTNIFRNWGKGLKTNFKISLYVNCIQLFAVFVVICNIRIFTSLYPFLPLRVFFIMLLAILILSIPYNYLLIMRFYMSTLEVIKYSFAMAFANPILSICNMIIFLFVLMLFEISAGTTVLFIAPIYAFCILISNRHLMKKLEEQVSSQGH